jgi:hypothetical protein
MANWAHVENNEITEVHDVLPKNWKNVSGLDLVQHDIDFLKSLGWYPVVNTESYDSTVYKITGYSYTFDNDTVTAHPTVEEIITVDNFGGNKARFIQQLREKRNELLIRSDWTQLLDIQNSFSKQEKYNWQMYRQKLRDLPDQYKNNEIVDIDLVVWPTLQPVAIP